ncbi:MAG: hypothetical protein J0H09_02210 [Burkholderiales bacterium]|nr:hypothetical protein [Burkholderiales bacterium]
MSAHSHAAIGADRRPLPPHGRVLADLRAAGKVPKHGICVHLGYWPQGDSRVYAPLAIPAGEPAARYSWHIVRDLDVIVRHQGAPLEVQAEAVRELLRWAPRRLRILEDRGDVFRLTWVKSVACGIEIERLSEVVLGPWQRGSEVAS